MPTVVKYKPAKNSTLTLVTLLVIICLVLIGGIIFVLLQVRSTSKTVLLQAADSLDTLANDSFQHTVRVNENVPIATDVVIDEEVLVPISLEVNHILPIKTEIPFEDELTVPLNLDQFGDSVPINTTIPFNQVITVPINLAVEQILPATLPLPLGQDIEIPMQVDSGQVLSLDSRVLLNRNTDIPLNLNIDEEFLAETTLFGQVISVPINLDIDREVSAIAALAPSNSNVDIPLSFSLENIVPSNTSTDIGPASVKTTGNSVILPIPTMEEMIANLPPEQRTVQFDIPIAINQEFPIEAEIPLDLPFGDEFTVPINKTIPIDMEIPVNLPVETEVVVPINLTVPIAMEVPVVMDIPIDIPLNETPFGAYMKDLSQTLRQTVNSY